MPDLLTAEREGQVTAPRSLPIPDVSEAIFQQQVIELAHITGWQVLHVRRSIGRRGGKQAYQTTTSIKGWPDLYLFRPGQHLAAELKREKGRLTEEQRQCLADLAAAGVPVHVWRPSDFDDIARVLGAKP